MMIARKLAIDELHITERALPLDNLDDNFTAADALIDSSGARPNGLASMSLSATRHSWERSVLSPSVARIM